MTKANLTTDEIRLVATLAKMEKQQDNIQFDALYLKISETPGFERAQSIKTISAMFAPILQHRGGAKFFLLNGDMVVLFPYHLIIIIEGIVNKIKFFVATSSSDDFARFYNLRDDVSSFFEYIKKQVSKKLEKIDGKEVYVDSDEELDFSDYYSDDLAVDLYSTSDMIPQNLKETDDDKKLKTDERVLSPIVLADNEEAISVFNFAACIKKEPIVRITKKDTKTVFTELSIDSEKFKQVLFPQVDFSLSPFLFLNLTKRFDIGLLRSITSDKSFALKENIVLNLNISSFLSSDFLPFDEAIPSELKHTVLIKLRLIDIFSDTALLPVVRSFSETCGYSLCFGDIPFESLSLMQNIAFHKDYIGFLGSENILTNDKNQKLIDKYLLTSGTSRLIMYGVDSEKILNIGKSLGIELFSGSYITKTYQKD